MNRRVLHQHVPTRCAAAIALIASACLWTGCDLSSYYPSYDIPDANQPDTPFDPPDDHVAADDGGEGFIVTSAGPLTGPTRGGTRVTIEGRGFAPGSKVYFGPAEGVETIVENEFTIRSATPEGTGYSETVEIKVVRPDGKKTSFRPGFTYIADAAVTSISPPAGPVSGGTPVTIEGYGFAPESEVVIGGRPALQVRRIDDSNILAITPAGDPGNAEVLVLSGAARAVLGRGYRYSKLPSEVSCSPAALLMDSRDGTPGIVSVLISGVGTGDVESITTSSGSVVSFEHTGESQITADVDFSGVEAGGPVDVTLSGPGGTYVARSCFTAMTGAEMRAPGLRVWSVTPASGPAAGGGTASLTVTGLDWGSPESLSVKVGKTVASVSEVPDMNTVIFPVPAGKPGNVDVRLDTPDESAVLKGAYTYRRIAAVTAVTPSTCDPDGGSVIRIEGAGLSEVVDVVVGPLPATMDTDPTDEVVSAVLPAVGPGNHDVSVVFDDGSSVIVPKAVSCSAERLSVLAITPDRGSMSGGTLVFVAGRGLKEGTRVFFGNYEAGVVPGGDPGRLAVYSPPADEEGVVDVYVVGPDGIRETLEDAFQYFNPTGFLGGTWGRPISGSINVTVLDSYNDASVPQAFVMLGSDPDTPYRGFTDGRGMITLSGPDLVGPVMVTATRQDYTAWTIVNVDAENVTIFLEPLFNTIPPDSGNGNGEDVFPPTPGIVSGSVIGTDKEFIVPPADCTGVPLVNGSLCRPCLFDEQCGPGSICVMDGPTVLTCSMTCESDSGCPDGWGCYQSGAIGRVCRPEPGSPEVRCATSDSSSARWSENFGPGSLMAADNTFAVSSRLGDVAVYCLGGFRRHSDGEFVPVVLGLLRHVWVQTSSVNAGNSVRLNIPLDRTMRLRMVSVPGGPDGPNVHDANLTLQLGSDGYLNLWRPASEKDENLFEFKRLPAELSGALDGSGFLVYAEADSPVAGGEPYSVANPGEWLPADPVPFRVYGYDAGPLPENFAMSVRGACSSGSTAIVIDDDSRPWAVDSDGFVTALPTIGNSSVNTCVGLPDGHTAFAGNHSAVWIVDMATGAAAVERVSSESVNLTSITASDDGIIWAAGGSRLFVRSPDGSWKRLNYGSAAPINDIEYVAGGSMVGVGQRGTVFTADETSAVRISPSPATADLYTVSAAPDRIVAAGRRGLVLTGPAPDRLKPLANDLIDDITASAVDGGADILLGGSRGMLARLRSGAEDVQPTLIRLGNDPGEISAIVPIGGLPGVDSPMTAFAVFMKAGVIAGPFAQIPAVESPPANWLWQDNTLKWSLDDRPEPSFFYVRMYTLAANGRWSILADGSTRSVVLPDLAAASGLDMKPLPSGTVSFRIYSVVSPGFNIDSYDASGLYSSRWTTWAVNSLLTKYIPATDAR